MSLIATKKPRFSPKIQREFFDTLKARVKDYFEDNQKSRFANLNMVLKTFFMLALYFAPFVLLLCGLFTSPLMVFVVYILMALGMSGIGLSIMHDANHGAYSKHKSINQFFGYLLNFLGGFHTNWKIQHNVLHHSFTNVHGFDEDLENGIMRFSPNQDYKKRYKLQAFYAWFFYGLMTLYWLIAKDFRDLIRYKNAGILKEQKIFFPSAMAKLVFNKLWYVGLLIALPIAIVPVSPLLIIGGFLLMHFICGLILALIFQPAHVIEETEFFEREENGSMENNWAIHQLKTTANFAKGSRLFSWLIGGLNFQIEHHLFPNICHVHYRKISKIVKETAKEFNLPYHEHVTFYGALKSHFSLLHQLGKAPVAA